MSGEKREVFVLQAIEYFQPSTVSEALAFLSHSPAKTKILAGGTDLVIQLRERAVEPDFIVDLANVKGLRGIESDGRSIIIGSMVTFSELEQNPLILKCLPILAQAAASVGSPQIRNMATIGGNIANAATAADSIPALLALDAKLSLVSAGGSRELALEDILVGVNRTTIEPKELITKIIVPIPQGKTFSSFIKIGRRKALAIARLNLSLVVKMATNQTVEKANLAVGAVGTTAYRVREVEEFLQGKQLTDEAIADAGGKILEVVAAKLGSRPTAPYKKKIAKGALIKALQAIKDECGGC